MLTSHAGPFLVLHFFMKAKRCFYGVVGMSLQGKNRYGMGFV